MDLGGVRIGGRNVTNIRYDKDTVLLADSEEKLQKAEERSKKYTKKTEVCGITKRTQTESTNIEW